MQLNFSPMQERIVKTTEGSMAVLAAAGSGKTRVITGRIRHVLEAIPGAFRVMALTFTNKAAEEMKSRLAEMPNIGERVFIGTIHSFCLNVIREKGNVIGYPEMPHIYNNETDRLEIVIEVLKGNEILSRYYGEKNEKDQRQLAHEALDYISNRKRNLGYIASEESEELNLLYEDYNAILKEQNAIDYDDIILIAYRIFTERPKIAEIYRKLYKYVCVDEAQDLNYAQYELIKSLCGESHRNVLMVGDDKQAIFGFNGSDKKYLTVDFVSDFQAERVDLVENFRNSRAVIRVANLIYPKSNDESNAVFEGRIDFYAAPNEKDEARYVVEQIENYIQVIKTHDEIEGEISYENICVIARNKFVFKDTEQHLKDKHIPYYYKKGSDTVLFETDPLRVFDLGIRVILNPLDRLHLRQIVQILKLPTTNITGLPELKQELLRREGTAYPFVVKSWETIEKNGKDYRSALDIIQNSLVIITNISDVEKLDLFNEIEQAKEFWKKYCGTAAVDSIALQGFFSNIALGMINVSNVREKGVALATGHSIKGLEYDIVFIIGLNEGSFPDYRAVQSGGKALEEEKNNTYVAITRAKRFLHLSYPQTRFMPWDKDKPYPQRVSRFLKAFLETK